MTSDRLGKIKRICLLALMLALTVIFCFVPVQFGTITLALMILPTLVVAQCCDFKTSLIMGLAMGLINYVAWFTTKAASPVAPIFQNPLVCILPRVLIAVASYLTRKGLEVAFFKYAFAKRHPYEYSRDDGNSNEVSQTDDSSEKADFALDAKDGERRNSAINKKASDEALRGVIYALSAAVGVVTNTLFVAIFTLLFFKDTSIAQNTVVTVDFVLAWFGLNFAIEVVAFSLITPPIVLALRASRLVN